MPFAQIPSSMVGFGAPFRPAAPVAGQTVSGIWPVAIINPPRPVERFDIATFTVPVAIQVAVSANPQPTLAQVVVKLWLSGLVIAQAPPIDINIVTQPGYDMGSLVAGLNLQAPISYRSGQTLQLGFDCQLDQGPITQLIVSCSNAVGNNVLVPSAGSIGYSIAVFQDLVLAL